MSLALTNKQIKESDGGLSSKEEDEIIAEVMEDVSMTKEEIEIISESSKSSISDDEKSNADIDSDDMIDCDQINNFEA